MKILVINSIYYIPISGINEYTRKIGLELSKCHDYNILTLDMGNIEHFEGINVIKLPPSKYNKLGGYESLGIINYLFKNLKSYDVINIHNYYSFWSLITSLICKLNKKPFILTPYYHGVRGTTKKGLGKFVYDIYAIFGKLLFIWAEKIICISEYEKRLIKQTYSIPKNKFMFIPPGVDEISRDNDKMKNSNDTISILYVGNLFESKGVQYIVQTLPILIKNYNKDVNLSIVGDGIYKNNLIHLIDELDISNHVNFYYNLNKEELNKKYKEADLFIILSSSEAYGMVVAEALAMGTPCIVNNFAALREFTKENGCFGIDDPEDIELLSKLIIEVHENKVKVGPFTEKIRTWDKVGQEYEYVYKCLIKD